MGDLVAVMQVGGVLAQFGRPTEILANPASDFVARFVGADRGLKRLSLTRVADIELLGVPTAHPGDDAAEAKARVEASHVFPYLLLLDAADRPIGWVEPGDIPASGTLTEDLAEPMSPFLSKRTTLKDALSRMLEAGVMAGIVVDENDRVQGIVTVEEIAAALRRQGGATRVIGMIDGCDCDRWTSAGSPTTSTTSPIGSSSTSHWRGSPWPSAS